MNALTPYQELYRKSLSHTEQLTMLEKAALFYGIYNNEETGMEAAAELARLTAIEQAAREFMQAADNVREWVETIDRTDSEDYNAKRVALAALLEKTK